MLVTNLRHPAPLLRAYALWWNLKSYCHPADIEADDDFALEKPDMTQHIRFSFPRNPFR